MSNFGNGNFEFIKDTNTRELYKNAHWAITQTKLWDWLANYKVDKSNGFMFSESPELNIIISKMREQPEITDSHSGSSYGITMRIMHYIAINGYDSLIKAYQNI